MKIGNMELLKRICKESGYELLIEQTERGKEITVQDDEFSVVANNPEVILKEDLLPTLKIYNDEYESKGWGEYYLWSKDILDYIQNLEISTLTFEQVKSYMEKQGSDGAKEYVDSLMEQPRKEQLAEAVKNDYHLCDFDRWQHLQDILFGNEGDTMKFETAMGISSALDEENIEVLELWSWKDKN